MKRIPTSLFKLALCALGLIGSFSAQAAYIPITLTGFTADVIANGTGVTSTASSSIGVDEGGYVFMAQDYNPNGTSFLPMTGLITNTATPGVNYQLASYSGNNSLRLPGTMPGQGPASGTLTFATPQPAGEIYALVTSGSAPSTVSVTVTFTDLTTQVFAAQTVADWYNGTPFVRQGLGRVQRGVENRENLPDNPRLYQLVMAITTANQAKSVQSVTFNKTSTAGVLNVFGITINSVCTGTPTAGTPAASVASACSTNSLNLTLTGASSGTGVSYQWQSSPAGTNTFTNLGASQTTTGYTVPSQTAATDYRVIVTCAASNLSSTSAIVSVGQNSFLQCYCTPTGGNCTNEWIRGVAISSLSNTGTTCTTGGYVSYTTNTALTTTLLQGQSYPITVDLRVNATNSQAGVWIDYNHNAVFEASEFTLIGTGPATGFANLNTSLTGSILIPATALTGPTRMRVRSNNGAVLNSQACFNNYSGEVEDYQITISSPAGCTGTPTAGTATSSSTLVCPATAFTLRVSGYTAGVTGITFQWQSRPAGAGTFTPIATATNDSYTVSSISAATDYRVAVTCTSSASTAFSTVVTVNPAPFLQCYCTPTYLSGGADDIIRVVTLGTMTNTTTLNNPSPYYRDYSSVQTAGTLAIPTIAAGATANVSVAMGNEGTQFSALWIDFNQDGIFGTAEYYSLRTNAGTNGTSIIPVAVPLTALAGRTKMRVRGGDDAIVAATMACGASASDYGEAEDYLVNVVVGTSVRSSAAAVGLTAYPVPATTELRVQLAQPASGVATVQLLDLTGKVIQTTGVANQQATFQLSDVAAGLYLVRYSDGRQTTTLKVSKQ